MVTAAAFVWLLALLADGLRGRRRARLTPATATETLGLAAATLQGPLQGPQFSGR